VAFTSSQVREAKNWEIAVSYEAVWANAFFITASIVLVLSILAAFILLCIKAEYLWWIALIIVASGALVYLGLAFTGHLTWGFSEIIGNTKRISNASGMVTSTHVANDELPEL
jgi:cytochrome c biogenesis protein CcdA